MKQAARSEVLENLLTCGTYDSYPFQARRTFITLNGLLFPSAIILLAFGIRRTLENNAFIALLDLSSGIALLSLLLVMRRTKDHIGPAIVSSLLCAVLFSLLYLHGVSGYAGALWIFFYPCFTLVVLGMRWGALLPLVVIVVNYSIVTLFPSLPVYQAGYSRDFAFIHMVSYFVFVLLGFVNETIFTRMKQALYESERRVRAQNAALCSSYRDLSSFVRVGSHHLQEPLRNVASYVQLLKEKYDGRLDAQAEEYIEFAADGAIWMKHLINDLIAYTTYGNADGVRAPVCCEECLRDALDGLSELVARTNADITHEMLPSVPGDRRDLVRLFQDLLGNALKFRSDRSPKIVIAARLFTRGDQTPASSADDPGEGRMWLFSVKDNGMGIDSRYAEKIFGVFEKLHPRSRYFGTGIGLAICRRIVEHHGGRIWFEANPDNGTTFYFTLPTESRYNELGGKTLEVHHESGETNGNPAC